MMKGSIYDEIRAGDKPVRHGLLSFLPGGICAAAGLLIIVLFQLFKRNSAVMNGIVRHFTTPFKRAAGALFDFLPFSAAEILCVLAICAALVFLVRSVWLLIRRDGKLLRLGRRVLAALAAVALVYAGYTVLWGVNYYADDFSDLSGISARGATVEELAVLTASFGAELNDLAGEVERDADGLFAVSPDEIFSDTAGLYDGISAQFPFLEAPDRTPKRMIFGKLFSRMDFTGFFFPFTGEAIVNTDPPACLLPATILHEMAHQRNIAAEDEANFVGIIAGLRSGNTVYAYSAALMGYIHLGNALYEASPGTYREIRSALDDRAAADLACNNAYWASFASPLDNALESVSTTVYEGFLQSYGESDGMKSYGKCVDLLVAYYFDYYWVGAAE